MSHQYVIYDREVKTYLQELLHRTSSTVDQQEVTILEYVAVIHVVQRAGIRAAANDRVVRAPGAVPPRDRCAPGSGAPAPALLPASAWACG